MRKKKKKVIPDEKIPEVVERSSPGQVDATFTLYVITGNIGRASQSKAPVVDP